MNKIFVPVSNVNDFVCYTVYDSNTIRAFSNQVQAGQNDFTDYFINSHYLKKEGSVILSSNDIPTCLNTDLITNDIIYRTDLSDTLIIVMFFIIFIVFITKIFGRIFGRWLKW